MSSTIYHPSMRTPAASHLEEVMSDISEACFSASWLVDLEYSLWRFLEGGELRYGFSTPAQAEITALRDAHEAAQGWVVWEENPNDGYYNLRLLPTTRWKARYALREMKKETA